MSRKVCFDVSGVAGSEKMEEIDGETRRAVRFGVITFTEIYHSLSGSFTLHFLKMLLHTTSHSPTICFSFSASVIETSMS